MTSVLVAPARFDRWVENFVGRHGSVELRVEAGELGGAAADGSTFGARLPFDEAYAGEPAASAFAAAVVCPETWGVLLVRKGGFAVARLAGGKVAASKVGRRHVQGRTKAGGQSQQRFARRRDNQARVAFEAAASHAIEILGENADRRGPLPVVVGGDRSAVGEVLTEPRLSHLRVVGSWFDVPDPRRDVLDRAVEQAQHLIVEVLNVDDPGSHR